VFDYQANAKKIEFINISKFGDNQA